VRLHGSALFLDDAVNLGAARMHAFGEIGLCDPLPLHLFAQLASEDARHRSGPGSLAAAVFIEEGVEGLCPSADFS
jgi:hypothetical protein